MAPSRSSRTPPSRRRRSAAIASTRFEQPSGTVIREYAGLDGKVFAVTWHGPFSPNLRQTLGSYFDQYAAAAPAGRQDRNHVQVRTSNLVVQVGGHMRAYSGRAYLPQALPSGVTPGDLQ